MICAAGKAVAAARRNAPLPHVGSKIRAGSTPRARTAATTWAASAGGV
jgi:hypothetical protein